MKKLALCILLVAIVVYLITRTPPIDPDKSIISNVQAHRGGVTGHVISNEARNEYNSLIKKYGSKLFETEKVRLKPDDGLEARDDGYYISSEHFDYFKKMSQWKHGPKIKK